MTHSIHPELVRAYRMTDYVVFRDAGSFVLNVGRVSDELARTMTRSEVSTAAFLTASNPASQQGDPSRWSEAQARLEADLSGLGLKWMNGEGRDPAGGWLSEPSMLVLGIALPDAERLARRYGQNGFLWIGSGIGLPALKLMHPLLVPGQQELSQWRNSLPADEARAAESLPRREQAALMSVPKSEVRHWLFPELWDITLPWPLARPDGSAMGIGTDLDRMFKLIAAGIFPTFADYTD